MPPTKIFFFFFSPSPSLAAALPLLPSCRIRHPPYDSAHWPFRFTPRSISAEDIQPHRCCCPTWDGPTHAPPKGPEVDRSFQTYVKETREVVCYACSHCLADLPPPTEGQGQSPLPVFGGGRGRERGACGYMSFPLRKHLH